MQTWSVLCKKVDAHHLVMSLEIWMTIAVKKINRHLSFLNMTALARLFIDTALAHNIACAFFSESEMPSNHITITPNIAKSKTRKMGRGKWLAVDSPSNSPLNFPVMQETFEREDSDGIMYFYGVYLPCSCSKVLNIFNVSNHIASSLDDLGILRLD